MSEQVYGQLTLFPEDFPVSRSALPGSSEAQMMTVTSGRKCAGLYENSGPLGCLVRMCLASSIWHSTRCLLTWKKQGTKPNASLFRLVASMPRTDGNGSQFWPTPSTGAALCGGTGNFKTLKAMADRGLITEDERRELSKGNGGKTNPGLLEWLMGYEQQFTALIPTPTAADYRGGCLSRYWTSSQIVQVERERAEQEGLRRLVEKPCGSHSAWEAWPDEPDVGRVAYGVSYRVDRIKALGNAVVPQQFYPFFAAIAIIEGESK